MKKLIFTPTEASSKLGVSRQTIYTWMKNGDMEYFTLPNGRRRIKLSEINRFLGVDSN